MQEKEKKMNGAQVLNDERYNEKPNPFLVALLFLRFTNINTHNDNIVSRKFIITFETMKYRKLKGKQL